MATIAEQLIGSVLQTSQKAPDIGGSIERGAKLAESIENVQMQRQKLELAKQEAMVAKADRIMTAIEKGSQFKDKGAQNLFFKNYVPSMVKALKMEEFFSPELMEYVQQSPEVRNKLIGLRLDIQNKINTGELRGAAIFDYAKSQLTPEELPFLDTDSLVDQQKFAYDTAQKGERAQVVQQGQNQRQQTQIGSAGQVKLAQDTANHFAEYNKGGSAAIEANIKLIEDVIADLESGKLKTGTVGSYVPTDAGKKIFAKDLVVAGNKAKKAIQASLKQTLGSQFTKEEGERVENRTFDAQLDPQANIASLKAEVEKIRDTKAKAEALFREQGFVAQGDWRSKVKAQSARVKALKTADQNKYVKALSDKLKISVEDVKKELGL